MRTKILEHVGCLCRRTDHYARAADLGRRTLDARRLRFGRDHPFVADALDHLAGVAHASGRTADAEPLYREALAIRHTVLSRTADVQSEQSQMNFVARVRETLDGWLDVTIGKSIEPDAGYEWVLRWKGQVSVRQQRQRAVLAAAMDSKSATLAADLYDATHQLAVLSRQSPQAAGVAAWRKAIAEAATKRDQLDADLAAVSAPVRQQRAAEHLTPAQLRSSLPPKTGLIDFLVYNHSTTNPKAAGGWRIEPRVVAFIVRADRPVVRVDVGPFKPIRDAIDDWRGRIRQSEAVGGPGTTLRDKLWLPVARHLDGLDTVLVSPDRELARLPFAALPGSQPGSYLVEELAIAGIPIPQSLPDTLAARGGAIVPTLVAVGGVAYDASAGRSADPNVYVRSIPATPGKWLPLPGTAIEAETVGKLFRGKFTDGLHIALTGAAATEDEMRRRLPTGTFVHFATHGYFATPTAATLILHPGLLSGLVLAGANRPANAPAGTDDGVFTAAEVAGLDMRTCKLAVLSACETGLGATAGGEGVLGLQRALQLAGAKSTVGTLWQIPDGATQKLMARFYDNLWQKKMPTLEALREAQIWMLKRGRADAEVQRAMVRTDLQSIAPADGRLPPFYWAAFTLSGDWR